MADPMKDHDFADMKGRTKDLERVWIPVYTRMRNWRPGGQSADARTVNLMEHDGKSGQKGLTQSFKRERYFLEMKGPRRILWCGKRAKAKTS
jgi:hypothetical protein